MQTKKIKHRVFDLIQADIVHYIRFRRNGEIFNLAHVLNSSWNREEFYNGFGQLTEDIDNYTFFDDRMKPIKSEFVHKLLSQGAR